MNNLRFQIGQQAWWATSNISESFVTCPDCGGTGIIRVLFHDDTMHSIECRNCGPGYEPPTGRVRVYERTPRTSLVTITGVEVNGKEIRWRTDQSYIVDDDVLFEGHEECMAKAREMAAEQDRLERERVNKKEKDTRSWAWHATYHRKCIKDAQRQIEYHTAKLNVASVKARESRASLASPHPTSDPVPALTEEQKRGDES